MEFPPSPYIDVHYGGLYVAGSGVSLDTVVVRFQEGASPERIVESFPTLKLSQVYGAIAYYLENEDSIGTYMLESQRRLEAIAPPLSQSSPELYARLEAARERLGLKPA